MPASRSWKEWLRLPSRLALMLGLGAAAVAGAPGQMRRQTMSAPAKATC